MSAEASLPTHLSRAVLEARAGELLGAPSDDGVLELIVVRPTKNERRLLEACTLTAAEGALGDAWSRGCWKSLPDGSPDPAVQLTLTSSRLARLVMGEDRAHWALAGDQLFVDLDLSYENLPPGQRLAVGDAVLEITAEPHNGCAKYRARFGHDALAFISAAERQAHNWRGIYARVVRDGAVRVGDRVKKLPRNGGA